MSDNIPSTSEPSGLDPKRMRFPDLARALSLSGPKPVTVEMLEAVIAAGAPVNSDGTLNLILYTAWLAREAKHGGD
jgi:hypothetical protein